MTEKWSNVPQSFTKTKLGQIYEIKERKQETIHKRRNEETISLDNIKQDKPQYNIKKKITYSKRQ
jgi:hypothetical protein